MKEETAHEFLITALGASAGGLQPLEIFFKQMPPAPGIAFVIVQHLAPDHPTALPQLLARHTSMPVEQAKDNTKVVPNRVYIIPPNATLTVEKGVLRVTPPPEVRGARTPIDAFFRSLAEDRGENAVCIMLFGTGTDGTRGLRAVKEHGGMAMAQTLESAQYNTILRSAIATGLVDHVLPVEAMPEKLQEYAAHLASLNGDGKADALREQINVQMGKVHRLLRRRIGHDFSQYKESTIVRRLERRMKTLQTETVEQYVELLERQPEEADRLFNDLLIGVTEFFRDPEAYEVLSRETIPKLFTNKGPQDQVRACIVGCATGEEAYSIAILLVEHADTLDNPPKIQLFATDIDEQALYTARKGLYPASIAEHVTPERLERFFIKHDTAWEINRRLRELCLFSSHSFIKDPPFSRLDLISCRNVMIYLGQELQRKIIPLFHYALRPGGYLFLGPSESVASHRELFATVDKKHRIFQRKESLPRPLVTFPLADITRPKLSAEGASDAEERDVSKRLERIILQRYRPACVAVKENGEAVYFSGRLARYLEHPTGNPDNNLVNLACDGLRVPLRSALYKATTGRNRIVQKLVPVETNVGIRLVDITVEPIEEFRAAALYMVVFEDSQLEGPERGDVPLAPEGVEEATRHLEHELRFAKEHAQAMLEELESANEELRSANEEYQSANEELETSKEELQSFNEELETVNTELNRKVGELDQANSDLQNLLVSTQIATIFLDKELRIKSFTAAAGSVFRLIPGDVGRPITDLATQFAGVDLVPDVKEVLGRLADLERQIEGNDGRHYQMRILPYRTVKNATDGVVMTFTDVTVLKRSRQQAEDAKNYAENIIRTVREPLLVLDAELRIQAANQSFYDVFRVSEYETRNVLLYAVGNGQWDIPELRRLLGEVFPQKKAMADYKVEHTFPHIGQKTMLLNAREIRQQASSVPLILLAIEDITERKRATALVTCQSQAFGMVASGAPLLEVLETFARGAERESHPGVSIAIHLLDESGTRFERTAAPSLPEEYIRATNEMEVRSSAGPCCASVSSRERVVISDVAGSTEFPAFNAFALPLGIRSAWSTPIISSGGKVLGTIAEYYPAPRSPKPPDDFLTEMLTRTAAVIIERKVDDEKLRRLNVDLTHFAYAASHDLQEPLRMVTTYTQLLARENKGKLGPDSDQFISYAVQGAQRMEALLRDLREYWLANEQKIEHLVAVDCNGILEKVLANIQVSIHESSAVVTHDSLPKVLAEELPLTLVFQNLISNAMKYRKGQPRIHVSARKRVGLIEFSVQDNGIGIEAEHLEKIFAPFKRLHGQEYPGTGIGLALCQKIVGRYGGRIWVESTYGNGSAFFFTIPAKSGDTAKERL